MDQVQNIVIGGGITGLACAYALLRRGKEITLIEPSGIGGLIQTLHKNGFTLELGPNVLLSKPEILSLLKDLSMEDQIVFPKIENYKQMVWFNGKAHMVPKGPLQFLRSRLIPLGWKFRIIKNIFSRKINNNLSSDPSVAEFFSKIIGGEASANILDPALKGIYGGDIERLRAGSIFPELFKAVSSGASLYDYLSAKKAGGVRARAFVLRSGMQSLVNALYSNISAKGRVVERKVESIGGGPGAFEVRLEGGSLITGRDIYITTSGSVTAKFIKRLDPRLSDRLSSLPFAPIAVVHLAAASIENIPENSFGILFPGALKTMFLGVMFNSELFPHVAPPGKQLLTVCLGGRDYPAVIEESDDELGRIALRQLSQRLGINDCSVLCVTKWPAAIPQFEEGHRELVRAMDECEACNPGLHFIGTDRGGVGVPDRVRAGINITG